MHKTPGHWCSTSGSKNTNERKISSPGGKFCERENRDEMDKIDKMCAFLAMYSTITSRSNHLTTESSRRVWLVLVPSIFSNPSILQLCSSFPTCLSCMSMRLIYNWTHSPIRAQLQFDFGWSDISMPIVKLEANLSRRTQKEENMKIMEQLRKIYSIFKSIYEFIKIVYDLLKLVNEFLELFNYSLWSRTLP